MKLRRFFYRFWIIVSEYVLHIWKRMKIRVLLFFYALQQ